MAWNYADQLSKKGSWVASAAADAVQAWSEMPHPWHRAASLVGAGEAASTLGAVDDAAANLASGLVAYTGLKHLQGVASALEGLGGVARHRGRALEAARLLGAAGQLRDECGAPPLRRVLERNRQIGSWSSSELGERYVTAWEEGVDAAGNLGHSGRSSVPHCALGPSVEAPSGSEAMLAQEPPTDAQSADTDWLLTLGETFTLVVYAQPVLENAEIYGLEADLVEQIFDVAVRDLSAFAVELHGKGATTPEQGKHCLGLIRKPVVDDERYARVWQDHVYALADAYQMAE